MPRSCLSRWPAVQDPKGQYEVAEKEGRVKPGWRKCLAEQNVDGKTIYISTPKHEILRENSDNVCVGPV